MKLLVIIACLSLAMPQVLAAPKAAKYYVAVNGSDRNPGTKEKPFATLERARDAIRALKSRSGGVTVWIRGGVYCRTEPFALTAEDSGSKDSPIVYRAFPGEEVRITGGREITGFKRITDPEVLKRIDAPYRDKILQCDLKALGITDFGRMTPRGFGRPTMPAGLELFFRGKPMTLARWPNDGWVRMMGPSSRLKGEAFIYEGDRPSRWVNSKDAWVHGYWTHDWAESYVKVRRIDPEHHELITEAPHGVYGYKQGARWRALNILEELDQPGEWYLDRDTGVLYFQPPDEIRKGDAWVSLTEKPLVSMQDASYVTVRGIKFEYARGTGIIVEGGSHNLIAGCTLRNLGNDGAHISGADNGIVGCDIYQLGDTGISLSGGDRMTLVPAGNFAENNDIHDFSLWVRTYRPGIAIGGVGNRIAHNSIHDAPHSGIILNGNEHTIEYNDIGRVCMETSDAGGFYLGRDFTERGNTVRYNYFHHLGTADVRAVYIDDDASDLRVFGNVFYKAKMGVCIGGGRDNVIENNIFVDCVPSVHIDDRGLTWAKPTVDRTMWERLTAVNFTQPPWSVRYPVLLNLYKDEPGAPKYNTIERNISFGGKWLNIYSPNYDKTITFRDNLVDADPGFVDPAHEDFRLRADSPAWKLGFKRIAVERIGLQMDEYRTALPAKESIPRIRKLGTIDVDLVEATPVVFKGKLYRFEYVRKEYKPNTTGDSYFRSIDVATGKATPGFAKGYHLGSAHVEGDTVYAYGVNIWGGTEIRVFWSKDLRKWQSKTALDLPGWGIFNTSVCKGKGRYVMAFEIDKPAEETGVAFTMRFAESNDLVNWKLMPSECVYSKDRYTACPALRFLDGYYYMIYLEAYPGPSYKPHIVRSRDFITWESSPRNPVMDYSFEDKYIANPKLTAEERERISKAVNINNSDIDLCEFQGKTVIYYSWGNQQGIEHLAEAAYDGTLAKFLRSFFPEK